MGFTNVEYHAYEIDKWAIAVAMSNFRDIQECGDAFKVRESDFSIST
jgi:DNA (cytosine-5)-methyltransferase 3A